MIKIIKEYDNLIVGIILFIALYFTVPSYDSHIEQLKQEVNFSLINPILDAILWVEDFKVENYLIFSMGRINDGYVSFGIFGFVITSDKAKSLLKSKEKSKIKITDKNKNIKITKKKHKTIRITDK